MKRLYYILFIFLWASVASAQVSNITKNKPVIIHPNPAVYFVDFTLVEDSNVKAVSVNDITGRLIIKRDFEEGEQKLTLDLSSWHGGIYIIQFYDRNNKVISRQKLEVAKK